MNKLNILIETEINGNISIFKEGLKKLTKLELLELIEIANYQYNIKRSKMINRIVVMLES